ncbi:hypothetical protein Ade02nite_45190 [Paractinoplanes deccanensis]|uniref:Integral membrane protein n=1 Tax=Paractinoplanes deccanensis TaxID=113561 RepID=A0ABQ3Y799_9ACTN|nr:hypothetical protein [Actinoplanes deccanensis]GID75878.1 hypothetical protein Ade02nite_45190 [Actinoplanes deccanensis]
MSTLERRYQRLIRLFYPAGYRREREGEIVGTYLDLAAPDKKRPSWREVADLAAGGVRQHVRATEVTELRPGLRLAGLLAMATATALAAMWALIETAPLSPEITRHVPHVGPFRALGIGVWGLWLLAAFLFALRPQWSRPAIGVALIATVAVVPLSAVTEVSRPPLFILLPQFVLGVLALAAGHMPRVERLIPLAVGAAAAAILRPRIDYALIYFSETPRFVMTATGLILLTVALLLAAALGMTGRSRGGWALLLLLGPIGLVTVPELSVAITANLYDEHNATYRGMAATAALVIVTATGLLLVALALHQRLRPHTRCAACGSPIRGKTPPAHV